MKSALTLLSLSALLAISCQQGAQNQTEKAASAEVPAQTEQKNNAFSGLSELQELEDATHFYVLGDWGRNGFEHQKDVANAMQAAAFVLEPEFIFSTGDNFYPNGIASVNDPYWNTSYEEIYNGNLLYCPWYVALGNHDYRGNPQAQIEYSNVSQRWTMPSRYFYVDKLLEDDKTTARFVIVDTNPFEDDYYEEGKYRSKVITQDTTAQLNWLDNVLGETNTDWTIAIGHHPFYTSGKRAGDVPYVRNHFEKVFEKHTVHAYFAGHEHDLQHQKPANIFTHHFVSGAGSEVRPTGKADYTKFAESISGFMIVSLTADKMLVQVVDYMGNVLYKTDIAHAKNNS